ncbi:MAG: laccase domain-containing protein [Spirochaetes bacterium]|nr:laccase domain-containing protein [Spirochaetota bacterium]
MKINVIQNIETFIVELNHQNRKYFAIFTKKVVGNLSFSNTLYSKEDTIKNIDNFTEKYSYYFYDKQIVGVKLEHKDNFIFFEKRINEDYFEDKLIKVNEKFFFIKFELDAIGAKNNDIIPLITFADCIPVALFDLKNGIFFSIHCGWKTTCLNIINKILNYLIEKLGSNRDDIKVIVGPSIFYDSYEFGEGEISNFYEQISKNISKEQKELLNLRENFIKENFMIKKGDKNYFDFRGLLFYDIKKENIEIVYSIDKDVFKVKEFSSFRRDKDKFIAQGLFTGVKDIT